ncbi:hypothetical protein HRbin28_01336 [bacterium HR28]|nr:hypothetical protein HRbin28_01336 [bacterium HR28]
MSRRRGQDVLLLLRPPTPKIDNAPYLTPRRTHAGVHDEDRSRHRLDKHEEGWLTPPLDRCSLMQ